jgi:HEAT repeat protein
MDSPNLSFEVGELSPYVVKVLKSDGRVSGTGFFCHPSGFVLTCRHVVNPVLNARWPRNIWSCLEHFLSRRRGAAPKRFPEEKIQLAFGEERLESRLRVDLSPEKSDLAVLEVLNSSQFDHRANIYPFLPLDVSRRLRVDDPLECFGFPQGKVWSANGIPIKGTLVGMTPTKLDRVKDLERVTVYPLEGFNMDNVQGGFSGAPVLNRNTNKVVGLIVAKHPDQPNEAFLVPVMPVIEFWKELRDFHDVRAAIRQDLRAAAKKELNAALGGSSGGATLGECSWIPPSLEVGTLPQTGEDQVLLGRHRRLWSSLDLTALFSVSGEYVLSADVGTGKTTLLRWLCWALLDKTEDALPILSTCEGIRGQNSLQGLLQRWVDDRKRHFLPQDLRHVIDSSRIYLLCDGLDQITGYDYSSVAKHAFNLATNNPVIIASRSSALLVLEEEKDLTFLGLQPFSSEAQQKYFGPRYDEARRLAALSPELAKVPMLASLLKKAISMRDTDKLRTRTELYNRYWHHTILTQDSNGPFAIEHRSTRIKIEHALELLAYRALAQEPPQIQKIEPAFFEELQTDLEYEILTRFGVIGRLTELGRETLCFTHQSYQEFLAARYADRDEHAAQTILVESGRPKWIEVIRFLVGLKGQALVDKILEKDENIIFSQTFLAAACAAEVSGGLSLGSKAKLESRLLQAEKFNPFSFDAIAALGQVRASQVLQSFLTAQLPEKRIAALNALGHCGEGLDTRILSQIVSHLDESEPMVRMAAIQALEATVCFLEGSERRLASEAITKIVTCLRDEIYSVRMTALETLGNLGRQVHADAVSQIVANLEDDEYWVRDTALMALGRLEQVDADTKLRIESCLDDNKASVRIAAVNALVGLRHELSAAATSRLVTRLQHDPSVRVTVIYALGKLGQQLNSEILLQIAYYSQDKDLMVRGAAIEALASLGPQLDQKTVSCVAEGLKHGKPSVREAALRVLSSSKPWLSGEFISHITGCLEDNEPTVRTVALQVLEGLWQQLDTRIVSRIADCVDDQSWFVSRAAIYALGQLGSRLDRATVLRIADRLKVVEPKVRETAIEVLGRLEQQRDGGTVLRIAKCLEDDEPTVREAALEVLGSLGLRLDVETIFRIVVCLLDSEGLVNQKAVMALRRLQYFPGTSVIFPGW